MLRECVESLLAQSVSDWEQIVVDDGSDTPAQEVLADFKDPRIRILRQPHLGISRLTDTYNFALENARGNIIAILEDDDLWPARKLECQMPAFEESDVIFSWGAVQLIDFQRKPLGCMPGKKENVAPWVRENNPPGRILSELLLRNIIPASTVMIRKQSLLDIGGFQGRGLLYVDYPTWLALSLKGRFAFCSEVCGLWRIHANQTTSTRTIEQQEAAGRLALECFDQLSADTKRLLGLSRRTVMKANLDRIAQGHLWRGRLSEIAHRRSEARMDFMQAWRKGKPATRTKASAAILLTAFGANLEKYVKLFGGIPFRADLN